MKLAIEKLQRQLTMCNGRYSELFDNLSRIFSKAQLQKLQSGKRVVWQQRDLRDSCALYATSPCAYNMLLKKGYPLPSKRTLQHWEATKRFQEADDDIESCSNQLQEAQQVELDQQTYDLIEAIDITQVDPNYIN